MMETSLRGELTAGRLPNNGDRDLLKAVEKSLRLSSTEELQDVKSYLLPAMMNDATIKSDIMKLKQLKEYNADMTQGNAEGRTALHIACCGGNIEVVQYLLTIGANVHAKDRFGHTPLIDAIENDYHEIISMLRTCGAQLHWEPRIISDKMCAATVVGNIKRLQSYRLAGANISQANFSGQTPLHFAILHRRTKIIKYLLEYGADPRCIDMLGQTPADLVKIATKLSKRINEQSKEQSKAELLMLLDL
ncbi:PREDICTED: L-asparaginase-like [Dinoponera quadriceps]|uniref:L-asparaginase-like n=1 Tax=Dinoponera quadriceps TaxID=609295 RepID=A0A6P3WXC8_DINQU|nr:PREDICTED: L-asparaginase-like [Dinoponera quadriceps]